jgi:peptidoglycan/LPS O-acetylase OafA/YrhL
MNTYASRALALVGTASFSIYLLHQALLEFLAPVTGSITKMLSVDPILNVSGSIAMVAIAGLPVVVGVSIVSFYLIENPFLKLRVRYLKD